MNRAEIDTTIVNQLMEYNPIQIGVFGSYARDEQHIDSDIDVLVSFKKSISLLQLISIENQLSEKLGIKVDLITENGVKNKKLINYIRQDLQILYHA